MPSRTPGLGFARHLRRNPSATERRLWRMLRDRRLEGLKFRRQVPIGPYVADFPCLSCKLIVEADGPLHNEAHDAERDTVLRARGFHVLRFSNEMIGGQPQEVLSAILTVAEVRQP
jgi:very-short-patch-repair endonuclease